MSDSAIKSGDNINFEKDLNGERSSRRSVADKLGKHVVQENITQIEPDNVVNLFSDEAPERDLSMLRRSAVITEMVDNFANHDFVIQEAAKYRTRNISPYNRNLKVTLLNTSGTYKMISPEQTDEYFKQIDAGVELYESGIDLGNLTKQQEQTVLELVAARQVVLLTNLRLVSSVSGQYETQAFEDTDSIEEGILGLMRAIDRYRLGKGTKFGTYAHTWIMQAVTRAISDKSRAKRIPSHRHDKFIKLDKQLNSLISMLGRKPNEAEILEHTGYSRDEADELLRDGSFKLPSLDAPTRVGTGSEEGPPLGDTIAVVDTELSEVDTNLSHGTLINELFTKAGLTDRQKMVIGLRYGLDMDGLTVEHRDGSRLSYSEAVEKLAHLPEVRQRDVGEIFGIGSVGAQKLEQKGFEQLKKVASHPKFQESWKSAQIN